jgi:hypothetical protein
MYFLQTWLMILGDPKNCLPLRKESQEPVPAWRLWGGLIHPCVSSMAVSGLHRQRPPPLVGGFLAWGLWGLSGLGKPLTATHPVSHPEAAFVGALEPGRMAGLVSLLYIIHRASPGPLEEFVAIKS